MGYALASSLMPVLVGSPVDITHFAFWRREKEGRPGEHLLFGYSDLIKAAFEIEEFEAMENSLVFVCLYFFL